MASLGTLTYDLIAKIGGFTSGMDAAERASAKSAKQIERNLMAINTAAVAVGTALGQFLVRGVDALVSAFPDLINQAAQFQDIAEKTGASAEGFAALAVSAKVGGVGMEELAAASIKLTKNLTGVDDESKAAGAALDAIGLSIKDFKGLAPEQQFLAIAKALDEFEEGAGKTAVATALLGKSGAQLLPFFKELAAGAGVQKILTAEQIKQADDYADRLARQKAQLELYASALATQVLPTVTAFTGALKDLLVEVTGVGTAAGALAANNGMAKFAENAGRALAELVDYIRTTASEIRAISDFIGSTVTATGQLLSADLAGARKTGSDFRARYGLDEKGFRDAGKVGAKSFVQTFNENLASAKRSSFAAADPRRVDVGGSGKPTISFSGAVKPAGGSKKGGADDPTKKLLENDLAAFKAMADQAKDLLADRNKILDLYNQQGLLSVQDYYAGLKVAQDDALSDQVRAIDAQIAALEKFKAAAKKDTEVADTQGKINKLEEEKAKLYRQSGIAAIESSFKQTQAQKAVQDAINEVNARLLEFNGNMREAAAIRFDAQNSGLRATFSAEGNAEALKALDTLRAYTLSQADLTKVQQQFTLAQGDLQIAEERITIARERGTMGEIESLVASGNARKEAVAIMQRQLAAFEALDVAARSPEQEQAIQRLKVQLEGLQATIDPLADKFNTMFSDAAGSAFADFINGTKSASEAFKSFTDTIFRELTNLIVKDLFKKLFSSGGVGGGIDFGSIIAGFFGGGKASGGPVMSNKIYRVNERGSELFQAANGNQYLLPGSNGRVIPNNAIGGGGRSIVINYQAQPGESTKTASQNGAALARQLSIADRRNN